MGVREELLLTKSGTRAGPGKRLGGSTTGLPISLLNKAGKRLQAVCIALIVTLGIGWLGANWMEGELRSEFSQWLQFGPGVTMLAASFIVLALARGSRFSPAAVIRLGLVYEVVISYCIPISEYWSTFRGVDVGLFNSDLVGLSTVALWMMFFTVLVPARPRHALIALTLSASSVPVTVALLGRFGDAPVLPAEQFFSVFVGPYAITVVMTYIAARIIYGLGRDILHAEEMGSYHLLELIGRGGMGEVWRASHKMLVRPAAIKLIRGDTLDPVPGGTDTALARFEHEAQATASLQSSHTVELYDFGISDDGTFYYVMELLDGIDLESLVDRFGPLPSERVTHIVRQACLSLAEAHRRGMIHRDVKPANIFLCQYAFEPDFVKVLDFGLVRRSTFDVEDTQLTKQGMLAGTPAYLAPEIAAGNNRIDGRADIYSLACVAYKLLTGRNVFEEESVVATVVAHVNNPPEPPSSLTEIPIPAELESLILSCLAKDPAARPNSCEELWRALEAVDFAEPWTRERAEKWWRLHLVVGDAEDGAVPIGSPKLSWPV